MGITPELLSDLVDYTSHRDKAVHNAARSLLKTLREVTPYGLGTHDYSL